MNTNRNPAKLRDVDLSGSVLPVVACVIILFVKSGHSPCDIPRQMNE